MEQVIHVDEVALPERRLHVVAVLVVQRLPILIHLDEVVADAQLFLHRRGKGTIATDDGDRIARHDVLERKQDDRYADEHRDELNETLDDVGKHAPSLLVPSSTSRRLAHPAKTARPKSWTSWINHLRRFPCRTRAHGLSRSKSSE